MIGDGDEESVFDRLWGHVSPRFGYFVPLWIVRRPETLSILDYRPTWFMFFTITGFLVFTILFILFLFNLLTVDPFVLWGVGILAAASLILSFRGTIREVYFFDKTTESYMFVRQFIHRREMIEGSLSQFTGARVKTLTNEEGESYCVVLNQEGMFLTGVSEQTLRDELPIFNSFDREARIANEISGFLSSKKPE
ncbi:MAG: hypothetical protein KIS76_10300 [Pyrinomonadaceae bacterium]|nr:hypothetical protein [Pyrinomonadaceae bacterium]